MADTKIPQQISGDSEFRRLSLTEYGQLCMFLSGFVGVHRHLTDIVT